MQQFIHLPANIKCSPQIKAAKTSISYWLPRHTVPPAGPGSPCSFPSLAICGTRGGIQVWSLQVTITALLPRLWRSSSFVSSQRSPLCSADWQVALSWTCHEPHSRARVMQEFTLLIYGKLIQWPSHIPWKKLCLKKNKSKNPHQIPHENTVYLKCFSCSYY